MRSLSSVHYGLPEKMTAKLFTKQIEITAQRSRRQKGELHIMKEPIFFTAYKCPYYGEYDQNVNEE